MSPLPQPKLHFAYSSSAAAATTLPAQPACGHGAGHANGPRKHTLSVHWLQTALQRGSLTEAAMAALLSIHKIVKKDKQVNNIDLEKQKQKYCLQ